MRSPDLGAALNNLGEMLVAQHQTDEAEFLFRRAATMLGLHDPVGRKARRNLASILKGRGESAEARELLGTESFDAFIVHDGREQKVVQRLALELEAAGVPVWLAEWEMVPGTSWTDTLSGLADSGASALVCVGASGSPWTTEEINRIVRRSRMSKVIPILLPGASDKSELPDFLKTLTAVDLREGITAEGIQRIVWGITGSKPSPKKARRELS
jgi:nucleotide-binding universal stress UspA family protein